jgi:hypothetical protein
MGVAARVPTHSLASPYAGWRLSPVTASELFDALAGLPGVRSLAAAGNGIADSKLVAGVEVARAGAADESALRRLWRERTKGGPVPLLLVADDPDAGQTLRALGPLSADGPLRLVASDDLLRVLERLPALPRLHAVRELAEELDRLDRTGVSGLQVKGLGTEHLFKERLRGSTRWPRLEGLAAGLPAEWRALLEALGYELERLPVRGFVLRHEGRRVAIVRPLADPAAFAKLDPEGRPPEGVLIADCVNEQVPYGLLVSGGRLRLFDAKPASGSAVARYLELDAAALTDEDRPLLGLLAPEYLAEDGFAGLMREARDFGSKMRERIDKAIRQDVLPVLGRELGRWAEREGIDVTDDRRRAELEAAALTFVFRALFLLYAESAGHLPMSHEAYRPHSLTQIVREAHETERQLGARSTALWSRIQLLVRTLREGNPAWIVPAYNGALFAADGFEGAAVLERAAIPDAALGPALAALGIDPETQTGFDFSGLEIGHLGHIYEGLLSLRLSVADRAYRYDARRDRYVAADGEAEIEPGDLLWLTDEGGRKGGGVYYTPEALVRHLVRRGVVPAFEAHLERVGELARTDPEAAARRLFEFRVLDPACGSAHFLVAVVDELADLVAQFLGRTPLPAVRRELDDLRAGAGETYGIGIEDVALLRRLVLKRCVYGVDLSPMGAEIAKISLWLASFVPGLALSYLDHNIKVGNSLIGVAGESGFFGFALDKFTQAIEGAKKASAELLAIQDRTPDEVDASAAAERRVREAVAEARTLADLWVAEPLGLEGARDLIWNHEGFGTLSFAETAATASELVEGFRGFHWPLEFPEVHAAGGFDGVVGNPPWEEITVEELAFYARYQPGLRALAGEARKEAVDALKHRRPDLAERLTAERTRVATLKAYFYGKTGYERGSGDPDLYKYFCQRYPQVVADRGSLAVVLPRSAFSTQGSADFRSWLTRECRVIRLDFLLNNRRWMFDTHPQYTVALLVAEAAPPSNGGSFEVAGVASSSHAFEQQSSSPGLLLRQAALGPLLEVPLLPSAEAADLLARLRAQSAPFPHGGARWQCFPTRELHETDDRELWESATEGRPLWKGESFDQFDPHGREARACPVTAEAVERARRPRAGSESILASELKPAVRRAAAEEEAVRARVAFRDVTNRTNSRTVVAALVPPETFLLNSAPYLVFFDADDLDRASCLAVMNSLSFDWQARRFVETHLNYFVLEGLRVPTLDDETYEAIARAAARLSCPDDRFADFAEATGVEVGPLEPHERDRLRAEIDALVARAWGLDAADLETIFADFTLAAVPEEYRERVRRRFAELT